MTGVRTPSGAPAPVAPLPSRELPRSVHFSMARSVHFSVAIDRCNARGTNGARAPGRRVLAATSFVRA